MSAVLPAPKPTVAPTLDTITLPVRLRPSQENWSAIILVTILFVGLLSLFALGSPAGFSAGLASYWIPMTIFAVPGSLYAAWLMRATIIADERGLRWRGMGRWQSGAWGEIRDYYKQTKPGSSTIIHVIDAGQCHLRMFPDFWSHKACRCLEEVVALYAQEAEPTERKMLGTRPELDWPRTFRYDIAANRWIVHQVSIGLTMISVLLFFPWHLSYSTVWWKTISLTSVFGSILWLTFKMSVIWKVKQAAYRRFNEQITVTPEGIGWEKGDESITAVWEEITDYAIMSECRVGLVYRILTPERNIDFAVSIQDFAVLKQIIMQEAIQAKAKSWRTLKPSDALGGVAAKWSSGCEGIGDRIYHYRTRSHRALLWLPTGLILPLLLTGILEWMFPAPKTPDPLVLMGFAAVLGLPVLWCWYRYHIASVRTNGDGITQYAPFGKKYIAWNDVARFYISGEAAQNRDNSFVYGNVAGPNTRIRFWIEIADVEELKDEITRRAIQAVGDWQEMRDDTDIRAISGYRK